ncbi:hypothetical protein P692DRAFT_20437567 [Suillus brevipes Sb2]|nr:hypothetical protein P692DRAFT_20437567 [Suillus brevipes Sb2]
MYEDAGSVRSSCVTLPHSLSRLHTDGHGHPHTSPMGGCDLLLWAVRLTGANEATGYRDGKCGIVTETRWTELFQLLTHHNTYADLNVPSLNCTLHVVLPKCTQVLMHC